MANVKISEMDTFSSNPHGNELLPLVTDPADGANFAVTVNKLFLRDTTNLVLIAGRNSDEQGMDISLNAGTGTNGHGGDAFLTSGDGIGGPAGDVQITAGNSDADAGDIFLRPGTTSGGGSRNGLVRPTLPTSDPGVSGALWADPVTHIVKVSP